MAWPPEVGPPAARPTRTNPQYGQPYPGVPTGQEPRRSPAVSAPPAAPASPPAPSTLLGTGPPHTAEAVRQLAEPPRGPAEAPGGVRRLARALTFGLLNPGAAAALERIRPLVRRIRDSDPAPRAGAFLAGKGGAGTTTTATLVALALAALRRDRVALVDVGTGTGSLARRIAGQAGTTTLDLVDGTAQRPFRMPDGLSIVDGAPWHTPVARDEVVRLVDGLRERHPITLLDIGTDVSTAAHSLIARADQQVLVTAAAAEATESLWLMVDRLRRVAPDRLDTAVVVLVCLSRKADRRVHAQLRGELGLSASQIIVVPYDATLTAGGQLDPRTLAPATREAYLRVAALLSGPPAALTRSYDRRS